MSSTHVICKTHIGRDVPMVKARLPILQRIMAKVVQTEAGCWMWQGTCGHLGYGQITVQGKMWVVHRLTYTLFKGEIQRGMQACHTCDNPSCCNPDHIFLGTPSDNAQDSKRKGRHFTSSLTHCRRGHEYAIHGVVREDGRRDCKECDRTRWEREKAGTGPTNSVKTHCKRGHPLSGDNLYVVPRTGHRQCKACRLAVVRRISRERLAPFNGTGATK